MSNELRAIQEQVASGPSTASGPSAASGPSTTRVRIEYPVGYRNLQAAMGLAGDKVKYNRWQVSFLPFFVVATCTVTDLCIL